MTGADHPQSFRPILGEGGKGRIFDPGRGDLSPLAESLLQQHAFRKRRAAAPSPEDNRRPRHSSARRVRCLISSRPRGNCLPPPWRWQSPPARLLSSPRGEDAHPDPNLCGSVPRFPRTREGRAREEADEVSTQSSPVLPLESGRPPAAALSFCQRIGVSPRGVTSSVADL
jgi:hypothetical protein